MKVDLEIQEILKNIEKVEYYISWYVQNQSPGRWKSRQRGSGLDFDKISNYIIGDDVRTINWKATAKTGGQVVYKNDYLSKRNVTVYFIVDVTKSMNFG